MRIRPNSVAGVGFCICAAVFLSFVMNDDADIRLAAPFICLFIVAITAFLWGRMQAILGAMGATLTFCLMLFPPVGSLRITNPEERSVLIAFQLLAVGIAFLAPPNPTYEGNYGKIFKRWLRK